MSYPIGAGIEISLNGSTWYKITDHNRSPIQHDVELIEASNRMANGKMRKYVIAQKSKIATDWQYVPSKTSECVDGNYGPAWLEAFYNANARSPMYLKVVSSEIDPAPSAGSVPVDFNFKTAATGQKIYTVFITAFSKTIVNRTKLSDYVNMTIEFTEI